MIQKTEPPSAAGNELNARNVDRPRQRPTEHTVRMRQFAETWRHAIHDLRGHLGVLKNSMAVMFQEGASGSMRTDCSRMFQESAGAMNALLSDLMALANVEAGRDQPRNQPFDAAALVSEVCEEIERSAGERGLLVQARGPAVLMVEGDAAKVRKIAVDLLAAALDSSAKGEVQVCYEALAGGDSNNWVLSVQAPPLSAPAPTSVCPEPLRAQVRNLMIDALCNLLGARQETDSDSRQGLTSRVIFSRPDRSAPAQSDAQ